MKYQVNHYAIIVYDGNANKKKSDLIEMIIYDEWKIEKQTNR